MAIRAPRRRDRKETDFYDNLDFIKQLRCTHKLFHERVQVIVPFYAAHSPEDIKLYGMAYNTGMTDEERMIHNKELVKVWKAPIQHIRLYGEGVPIFYPSRQKAANIFFYINAHVKTWRGILGESMNYRSSAPPVEDFDIMMEFANNLEQFLIYHYNEMDLTHGFRRPNTNRFADEGDRTYNSTSTYGKYTKGEYGFSTHRKERTDTLLDHMPQRNDVYQSPLIQEVSDDDLLSLANMRG